MNMPLAKRWYVVQTRPSLETRAAVNLERQGFEVYLPRYQKSRRHARRVDIVTAPLFPRYVFVAFDIAVQRWRSIHSTFGVAQLVCHGEHPSEVPDWVIGDLKRKQDHQGLIQFKQRAPFKLGDRIQVLDGVFSTSFGWFERMADSDRVAILLNLLGRKVRVMLDVGAIEAA